MSEYQNWGAANREEYMHKNGGVKATSLFTLGLLLDHVDELSPPALNQLTHWADGDAGWNFGEGNSERGIRSFLPGLPQPPLAEDSQGTPLPGA